MTSIPIHTLSVTTFPEWLQQQDPSTVAWLKQSQFVADPNQITIVPTTSGQVHAVVLAVTDSSDFWPVASLPGVLPEGDYHLVDPSFNRCLAWQLGAYRFAVYKKQKPVLARLSMPAQINQTLLNEMTQAIFNVRDWINTPTEEMRPPELVNIAKEIAKKHNAQCDVIQGDKLLTHQFNAIHAVGRAGTMPPCLIDLRWGNKKHPKVTLVGKGVCFDTGGLDIKNAAGMLIMKKDMGGAAHALALASLIMSQQLPIHLRVLIPAVENNVSSNSYRPGDVIRTHAGLTVEITNTDAEGRMVLCEALSEAMRDEPECVIDFSTLTGAARVALGPDLPVFFCNNAEMTKGLLDAGLRIQDPLWQLPLHMPYMRYLVSDIADMVNSHSNGFAGAIVAALFLQQFVSPAIAWAHFDIYAWNADALPGRPRGADATGLRAVYEYLSNKYPKERE